jgi:hypothetical protein
LDTEPNFAKHSGPTIQKTNSPPVETE